MSRFDVTRITGVCETKKNGDSDASMLSLAQGRRNTQHCVRGSMIIAAIEERKLGSSREKILDNTEPWANIRRIQCLTFVV